jgi:hypothetical protein
MKLEYQVCTLEQAKKLHELGVAQNSLFYYYQDKVPSNPNMYYFGYKQDSMPFQISFSQKGKLSTSNIHAEYSAFTVSELGVMLPPANDLQVESFKTEAECRASMLIELMQRNIITNKQCNQRLTDN